MNILMLEDDPAIAQGLRYSLESEGYTVTHCATVTQALEAVGARPIRSVPAGFDPAGRQRLRCVQGH